MEKVLIIISIVIGVLCLVSILALLFFRKKISPNSELFNLIERENEKLKKELREARAEQNAVNSQFSNMLLAQTRADNENLRALLKNSKETDAQILKSLDDRIFNMQQLTDSQLSRVTKTVDEKLSNMQNTNSEQLKQIKETVDEKLNANLTARLNESFNVISERLEALYKGFGEMKELSSGVLDLRRVLSNVKTRGILGEVQLGTLLDQMLAPNQYLTNTVIKPNSAERVEYAIILPGKNNENILLPIDAKFPIEDYIRLCDFSDKNMQKEMVDASKAIENRIKQEAKKIYEKYVEPPITTDFAIMYIPTEGLFSEIMRMSGLVEEIQNKYKVIICSPTTICALLSSLQMGFKTLYIERRSSEIFNLLESFKTEFVNFTDLINKTQKKILEASDTLESAGKKSAKIQKRLTQVTSDINELPFEE